MTESKPASLANFARSKKTRPYCID